MPKQRLNETTETNRLKKDIKAYDPCAFVHKVHGGTYGAGLPDLMIIHDGQTYWLEMKVGNNKPTDRQMNTMMKMRDAGARVAVATVTKTDGVWEMGIDGGEELFKEAVAWRHRGDEWPVEWIFNALDDWAEGKPAEARSAAP